MALIERLCADGEFHFILHLSYNTWNVPFEEVKSISIKIVLDVRTTERRSQRWIQSLEEWSCINGARASQREAGLGRKDELVLNMAGLRYWWHIHQETIKRQLGFWV